MTEHAIAGMDRDAATRRVMTAIAVGPHEVTLPFTAPDGSQPLIVTTPNEYLSAVIARLHTVGGSANIALAQVKNFSLLTLTSESGAQDNDADEVNEDISMGMFFLRANSAKGRGTFRLKNARAKVPSVRRDFAYAN